MMRGKDRVHMGLPVVVLGGGGHAKVLIEILEMQKTKILGISLKQSDEVPTTHYPVIGNDEDVVKRIRPDDVLLVNAVGSVRQPYVRQSIFEIFRSKGYRFATLIHPSAIVARNCSIGEGAQIMAGAVIQPGARIGHNVIVNTRASIDHDTVIGDHTHVATGAVIAGNVRVSDCALIGAGATVIQNIKIGKESLIAAGSVVVRDVQQKTTVMGVPAREVQS